MVNFAKNFDNWKINFEQYWGSNDVKKPIEQMSDQEIDNIFQTANEDGKVETGEVATMIANLYTDGSYTLSDLDAEYLELFETIAGYDGNANEFSESEIQLISTYMKNPDVDDASFNTQAEKIMNSSDSEFVAKADDRIQYDESGKAYVLVEPWSNDSSSNNCLERIVANSYDLEKMGIKRNSPEFNALLEKVMDANPDIYGTKDGSKPWRTEVGGTGRVNAVIHDGEKINLPGLEKVKEKQPVGDGNEIDLVNIDQKYKDLAIELNDAVRIPLYTNDTKIAEIIDPNKYSAEELVYIMKAYSELYGESLVTAIADDYKYDITTPEMSRIFNKQYQEILARALVEVSEGGSEEVKAFVETEISEAKDQGNNYFLNIVETADIESADSGSVDGADNDGRIVGAGQDDGSGNEEQAYPMDYASIVDSFIAVDGRLDIDAIMTVVYSSKYSSEDIVNIMKAYQDKTGNNLESDIRRFMYNSDTADALVRAFNQKQLDYIENHPDNKLTDAQVIEMAKNLFGNYNEYGIINGKPFGVGINEENLQAFLFDDSISSADKLRVINKYRQMHGGKDSLKDEIKDEYYGDIEQLYVGKIEDLEKEFGD